jgi:hypothetical protein
VIFVEQAKQMDNRKLRAALETERKALVETGLTDVQRLHHSNIIVIALVALERSENEPSLFGPRVVP